MIEDPDLLLCYDGSDQAAEAIDFAAALFPGGTRATVLYAWELTAVAVAGGFVPAVLPADFDEQDEARVMRLAEAGAHHARARSSKMHRTPDPLTAGEIRRGGAASASTRPTAASTRDRRRRRA
jgi:hypothetical protein